MQSHGDRMPSALNFSKVIKRASGMQMYLLTKIIRINVSKITIDKTA